MRSPADIIHNGRSLADILVAHATWLRGEEGGERADLGDANLRSANLRSADLRGANLWGANLRDANLRSANLRSADLRGANLWDANLWDANLRSADLRDANLRSADLWGASGNMIEIKSLHIDTWPVAWVQSPEGETTVQIGCQRHPLEMWRKADPRWIAAMDAQATDWWAKHGALLLAVVDANPATPYGKEKDAADA